MNGGDSGYGLGGIRNTSVPYHFVTDDTDAVSPGGLYSGRTRRRPQAPAQRWERMLRKPGRHGASCLRRPEELGVTGSIPASIRRFADMRPFSSASRRARSMAPSSGAWPARPNPCISRTARPTSARRPQS